MILPDQGFIHTVFEFEGGQQGLVPNDRVVDICQTTWSTTFS